MGRELSKKTNRMAEIKQQIELIREENTKLYHIFQYRLFDDEMQPLIQKWRDENNRARELMDELIHLENLIREETERPKEAFINSYGEATHREITSISYKRAMKRTEKAIMSFMSYN